MKRSGLLFSNILIICLLLNFSPVLAFNRSEEDSNAYWYGETKYQEATIYGEDITVITDSDQVIPFEIKLKNHSDFSNYTEFKVNPDTGELINKIYTPITVFDPNGTPSNSAENLINYTSATKDNPFGLLSTSMKPGTFGKYEQYPENIDKIFKFLRGNDGSEFIYGDSYNAYDYLLPYEGFNLYIPSVPDEVGGDTATGYVFIQKGAAAGTYSIDTAYMIFNGQGTGKYPGKPQALISDVLNITILPEVKALTFADNSVIDIEATGTEVTGKVSNFLKENDLLIELSPLFIDAQNELDELLDPVDGYSLYQEHSSKYIAGTVERTSENGPIKDEEDVWIYYSSNYNKIYQLADNQLIDLSGKSYADSLIDYIKNDIRFEISPDSGASYDKYKQIIFTKNGIVKINATYNGQSIPVVSSEFEGLEKSSESITVIVSGIKKQYQVTATSNSEVGGTVSGTEIYVEGSSAKLTATPVDGYQFTGWFDGDTLVSTENPYIFTVTKDITLSGHFTPLYPTTPNEPSTPNAPSKPTTPNQPANPSLPSTPTNPTTPDEKPSQSDKVVVEFENHVSSQGSVKGSGTYTKGEIAQLTAEANEGYHFSGWAIDGKIVTDANPLPIEITEDTKLEPVFTKEGDKEPEFEGLTIVEVNQEAQKGSIIGTGQYAEGRKVTLVATPEEGYLFDHWEVNTVNAARPQALNKITDNPYTFIAKNHTEVNAVFKKATGEKPEENPVETNLSVYRLYNIITHEHLYTTDLNEKNVLSATPDWNYEGKAWQSPTQGTGVYRLYSPITGNHLYTKDTNEYKVLTTERGWVADNNGEPLFYSGGDNAVYRLYHEGILQHLLTTDKNEYNVLKDQGWTQEGTALYSK